MPLCLCQHWRDQHDDDARVQKPNGTWVIGPCTVAGCWCAGAGFFGVAKGSRHRPGHATYARPWPVREVTAGQRILVTYAGAGRVKLGTTLAGSLIAEVEKLSWSGDGDLWHISTDLGLIPLVKGRSSVRVVNKT